MKPSSPWAWIPTLYFAQGLPYVAVMTISVIMYKRLGISNAELAFYTGWLNLPWVIKPLWSPFIDLIKTKRWWITWMQLLIGAGLAGIAFTIPTDYFFQLTLAIFWLMAFSSATHDIAADGFYMLGLSSHEQALFVGIRSTFYRIATIAGQGLLIMLAGHLEKTTNNIPFSWSITFMVLTGLFMAIIIIMTTTFTIITTTIVFSTVSTASTIIITFIFIITIIVFMIITFFITTITSKSYLVNTSHILDSVKRLACFFSLTIHYYCTQFIAEETGSEKPNNPRSWNH